LNILYGTILIVHDAHRGWHSRRKSNAKYLLQPLHLDTRKISITELIKFAI